VRHSQVQIPSPLRFRRWLSTTRVRWSITAAVALCSLTWTVSTVKSADAAASAWGQRRTVPVATSDLEPGRVITTADITFVDRPIAVVPNDVAVSPIGRSVTRSVARDEVVLERRLAGGSATGAASQLDENSLAFAIPSDASTPPIRIGDHVALYAPSEVIAASTRASGPASRIADRAVVIAVSEEAITVGVVIAEASAVAKALLSASVIIALAD
jgi:hypothetical protein